MLESGLHGQIKQRAVDFHFGEIGKDLLPESGFSSLYDSIALLRTVPA